MAELRTGATLEALSEIGAFVQNAAREAGLEQRVAYRLRLAVDEIATNAIVHGRPGRDAQIRVTSHVSDDALRIVLEDAGPAFNPLEHEGPHEHLGKPAAERPIGGLGVFLAVKGVDRFEYDRLGDTNRNVFIVERRRPQESAP